MKVTPCLGRKVIAFCAVGILSACSLLPKAQTHDSYRLPTSSFSASASKPIPVSLLVTTPGSGRLLDGLRILVIRNDNQINVYKNARWSDPAPILARDRILDAFQKDGRIQFVTTEAANLKSDIEMHSDLRSFHVEYRENLPFVLVQLDARLVKPATRSIVATRSFSIALSAPGDQVPDIVKAFGTATDQLAQEVVEWTTTQAPPAF